MKLQPAGNAIWPERAAGLLHAFVEAACQNEEIRGLLQTDPAKALYQWQWEHDNLPASLLPPAEPVSVTLDEETLWGPLKWRTQPEEAVADFLLQPQWRLLAAGAKPLALIHGDEQSLAALGSWARSRGYFAVLGPHEFLPRDDSHKGGYSNSMEQVGSARPGSGAWRGLLVAADEQTVLMAWLCQLFDWETLLGRLLGYPDCCCDAFARRWPTACMHHEGDVGITLLAESKPEAGSSAGIRHLDWTVNIFARYFGWEIIQHFPCSWDCGATAAMARRYFSVLSRYWPGEGEVLMQHLSAPLLIMPGRGYALFPGARVVEEKKGTSLCYDPERLRIVGMESASTRLALSSGRLYSGAGEDWRIHGSEKSGWLLSIGPGLQDQQEIGK